MIETELKAGSQLETVTQLNWKNTQNHISMVINIPNVYYLVIKI